ncbi:MAG: Brp/Blh family beta-carotene 15,15'-dioxygenase, partial [Flavobacteriales bacterium]|nr:Brp/Blh family beta-carotene 15,15'-dioxygenase [Flavobacteriales bacterium]
MSKAIFIFIASLLLLLPMVLSEGGIDASTQMVLCLPFILFIGIPHGAIDNLLYLREKKLTNTQFISIYLIVVFGNVLLWMFFPICAYLIFLMF